MRREQEICVRQNPQGNQGTRNRGRQGSGGGDKGGLGPIGLVGSPESTCSEGVLDEGTVGGGLCLASTGRLREGRVKNGSRCRAVLRSLVLCLSVSVPVGLNKKDQCPTTH